MLIRTVCITVFAALVAATGSYAQKYYFYDESGTKVPLVVNDSLLSIAASDDGLLDSILAAEPALAENAHPFALPGGFYLLHARSGYAIDSLVQRLRTRLSRPFVNNLFECSGGDLIYLTSQFACEFQPWVTQAEIDSMNKAHGVVIEDTLFEDRGTLVLGLTAASDLDVLAMGNLYYESGLARYARADIGAMGARLAWEPNDPYWQYQWYFNNPQPRGFDIELDKALEYYIEDGPITVALLDDGFAPHEDFPASRIVSGYNYYDSISDYSPPHDRAHGMCVTGILAATVSNALGISSVAGARVRVIEQRIFSDPLPEWGYAQIVTTDIKLACAINDAVNGGAKVMNVSLYYNCSQGGDCGYVLSAAAFRRADSLGVSLITASGNRPEDDPPYGLGWPSYRPEMIAVGATKGSDARWPYSQYGPELDVVAPSGGGTVETGDIWSLDQMGTEGYNPNLPGLYCSPQNTNYMCAFGGTSASTPQVAGIVALIRTRDTALTVEQVRQVIRYSSDRVNCTGSWDDTARVNNYYGWGRVNADRALMAIVRGDANNDGVVNITDAVYLIAYIQAGGSASRPHVGVGDANCDGAVNMSDVVYLITYIFQSGPEPLICYHYTY